MKKLTLLLLLALPAIAQESVDHTHAADIRPYPVRSVFTGYCKPTEHFTFDNGSGSYSNQEYVCGNFNNWQLVTTGGGGGSSAFTGLTDAATAALPTLNTPLANALGLKQNAGSPNANNELPLTFTGPLTRSTNTIGIAAASGSVNGYLASADWSTFNAKQAALGYTPQNAANANSNNELPLTFSAPITRTGNTLSIAAATGSVNGYLTSADWTTFNSKVSATAANIAAALQAQTNCNISGNYYTPFSNTCATPGGGVTTNGISGQALTSNGSGGYGTPVTLGTAASTASTAYDASGAATAAQAAAIAASAQRASNLSDLASAVTARTNLGLGSSATQNSSAFDASGAAASAQAASLQVASNLSDVAVPATARTNLGLGSAATQASTAFDAAGAATTAQAAAVASSLQKSANLSDVANAVTARTNLGLGTAATTASSAYEVPLTVSVPIIRTVNALSIQNATDAQPGAMTAADHVQQTANTANIATNAGTIATKQAGPLSGDVTTPSVSNPAATLAAIKGVPFCTGFTPTNGQSLQYTTASTPNPCYTAATSSGSGLTVNSLTVTSSATPTFTVTTGTSTQVFTNALTANVTSSTLSPGAATVGQHLVFRLTEDATANRTFAWPSNVLGAAFVKIPASGSFSQEFVWDGTNANAIAAPQLTGGSGNTLILADGTVITFITGTNATVMYTTTGVTAAQLPALTGDATSPAGSAATTVVKVNGGSVPASAPLLGTNSSSQPVPATGHAMALTIDCVAASASGTAYICTTSPSFTPASGDFIKFKADVANTGTSPTLSVNGATAAGFRKQGGTAALAVSDIASGAWLPLVFDGTFWQMGSTAAATGGTGAPGGSSTQLQYNSAGAFAGATQFTTDGTTITAGSSGVIDMGTNNAKFTNLPQAPVFAAVSTDEICAATGGTGGGACTAGAGVVVAGTAETPFQRTLILPVNTPGASRGVYWTMGFNGVGTAGPAIQYRVKACLQANYTAATGVCSAGGVLLWSSINTATLTASSNFVVQGAYRFLFATSSLGTVNTLMVVQSGGLTKPGAITAASQIQTSSVPMTTGTWVIYTTFQFAAATAGNWVSLDTSLAEWLN